jgi:hypothetical protein
MRSSIVFTHYCSGDQIEKNEVERACNKYGGREGVYRILVGTTDGKRLLGRSRHRKGDNIKMGLQEVRCEGMDWIDLALGRHKWREIVHALMYIRGPYNAGNILNS